MPWWTAPTATGNHQCFQCVISQSCVKAAGRLCLLQLLLMHIRCRLASCDTAMLPQGTDLTKRQICWIYHNPCSKAVYHSRVMNVQCTTPSVNPHTYCLWCVCSLFKVQARYIVERMDSDLWNKVLLEDNQFRRQLIDQVCFCLAVIPQPFQCLWRLHHCLALVLSCCPPCSTLLEFCLDVISITIG